MLDRIARDNTTVASPLISQIVDRTFRLTFHKTSRFSVGGFNFDLQVSCGFLGMISSRVVCVALMEFVLTVVSSDVAVF